MDGTRDPGIRSCLSGNHPNQISFTKHADHETRKDSSVLFVSFIVSRILQISADHTDTLSEAREGQIVAIQGINTLQTGDTLISPKDAYPVHFEPLKVQAPVFTVNVEAENQLQLNKLEKVLHIFEQEDPSLLVKNDEESGQLLLSGMGELHLEVLQQRLKREFSLDAYYSKMRVNYRESVRGPFSFQDTVERVVGSKKFQVSVGFEVDKSPNEQNEIVFEKTKYVIADYTI